MNSKDELTKFVYKNQFSYSIEKHSLPEGFVKYHKNNFCQYFKMKEEEFIGKNLLDTGCGPGKHAAVLALMGANVTALDLTDENIASGKKLASEHGLKNLNFKIHDLMLPIQDDSSYDLISAHNWMQHSKNPSVVFTNLVNKLKVGGRIYLSLYHANTFRFFITHMARQVLTSEHYAICKRLSPGHFPFGFKVFNNPDDIYFENFYDDFFVPYCHSTNYQVVCEDAKNLGLKPITEIPDNSNIFGLDNIPLRVGFEKVENVNQVKELHFNHPLNEFETNHPDLQNSIVLGKELIKFLNTENDKYLTSSVCLGMYRIRAELNKSTDVAEKHQALQKYIELVLDADRKNLSYFFDAQSIYF